MVVIEIKYSDIPNNIHFDNNNDRYMTYLKNDIILAIPFGEKIIKSICTPIKAKFICKDFNTKQLEKHFPQIKIKKYDNQ